MEKKFTEAQTSAIETRDKTLLVFAAAGSGKTATLTERIIRRITDAEHPEDISDMLIVTFTRAAAAELKERITGAVRKKLEENPQNEKLKSQLYKLPGARISTIDSFLGELLRSTAERLGISPSYRIADPLEASILARATHSLLIDAIYDGEAKDILSNKDFEELSASLTGIKSEGALEDILDMLYEKSRSLSEGFEIYRSFAEKYRENATRPLEESDFGIFITEEAREVFSHYYKVYERLLALLPGEESAAIAFFSDEMTFLSDGENTKSFSAMEKRVSYAFPKRPQNKNGDEAFDELISARDSLKKELSELKKKYFFQTEAEVKCELLKLAQRLDTLYCYLKEFDRLFFEEKRQRNMLEYSDVERLIYKALYKDGEPTDFARSVKEQFSSVYIDEYQDVSGVQDAIFRAISREDNRFMVGDIKQSIYGFRGSEPEFFAKMKSIYPPLKEAELSPAASIFMSANFRCDKAIIDFVNGIFDKVFALIGKSISYTDDDRLIFSKTEKAASYIQPKICILAKEEKTECEDGDEAEEKEEESSPATARWVAKEIAQLLKNGKKNSGEPIKPKDIVILLRGDSTGERGRSYAAELSRLGIETNLPELASLFSTPEVQLALCILNAIDNPRRDIYLAGALCSPIYSFTADELYLIKKFGAKDTLYDSLLSYTEKNPEFQKGRAFIETLSRYRSLSEGLPTDALILRIYDETNLLALASGSGREENLFLLYNYARSFEGVSYSGLYAFIDYVNSIIETGKKFSSGETETNPDAVTVMTIHKSKGLEFPVVFLCETQSSLTGSGKGGSTIQFDRVLGLGMRCRSKSGLALVNNPLINAIKARGDKLSKEEEMRIFYVALTRARERLYVVGKTKYTFDEFLKNTERRRKVMTPHTITLLSSFLEIAATMSENECLYQIKKDEIGGESLAQSTEIGEKKIDTPQDITDILIERLKYRYPREHLTTLPEKLSVSKLYPEVLDGCEEELRLTIDDSEREEEEKPILPEFITGKKSDESAKRGIATHTFLQFCDMERLKKFGAKAELERLYSGGFLSEADRDRVRLSEIDKFISSKSFDRIIKAKKCYRELRFNVRLPADKFTKNEERADAIREKSLLLQGVFDCLIEDGEERLHLIDYKTDRLTRDELSDPELAKEALLAKHSLQLSYYADAVFEIFGRRPDTVEIFSLHLGREIPVN